MIQIFVKDITETTMVIRIKWTALLKDLWWEISDWNGIKMD